MYKVAFGWSLRYGSDFSRIVAGLHKRFSVTVNSIFRTTYIMLYMEIMSHSEMKKKKEKLYRVQ